LHAGGPGPLLLPARRADGPLRRRRPAPGPGAGGMTSAARRDELAANLAAVQARIDDACRAAGRNPADVTLVVVTKFFPADDVAALVDLGVKHVGENRDQEASAKVAELEEDVRSRLTVHFVGQLQTNK